MHMSEVMYASNLGLLSCNNGHICNHSTHHDIALSHHYGTFNVRQTLHSVRAHTCTPPSPLSSCLPPLPPPPPLLSFFPLLPFLPPPPSPSLPPPPPSLFSRIPPSFLLLSFPSPFSHTFSLPP